MIASVLILLATVCGPPLHWPASQSPGFTVVQAKGIGLPPPGKSGVQARLMAQRAAEVNAVRNLTRMLGGPATRPSFRYVSRTSRPDGSVEVVVETRVYRKVPVR